MRSGKSSALALPKGNDRVGNVAKYRGARGERIVLRRNATMAIDGREYKVLGRRSATEYVLKSATGPEMLQLTHVNDQSATVAPYQPKANELIENDRLYVKAGARLKHEPARAMTTTVPDAGYMTPNGTKIMRKKALAQRGAPAHVAFPRGADGAHYAKLTWTHDVDEVLLGTPTVSLLAPDGKEFRAKLASSHVFVAEDGEIRVLDGQRVVVPQPSQQLSLHEWTLPSGAYAKRTDAPSPGATPTADQVAGHLVDHDNIPVGVVASDGRARGLTASDFATDDVIAHTAPRYVPFADKHATVTGVAVRLADGTIARGTALRRTATLLVLEDAITQRAIVLTKPDASSPWRAGDTDETFVDAEGDAWEIRHRARSDGDTAYVVAYSIVGPHTPRLAKVFSRRRDGDRWITEPAGTKSIQFRTNTEQTYVNAGTAYRIVATPASPEIAGEVLADMFDRVGKRPRPDNSDHPVRQALEALGVTSPATWETRRTAILTQLRAGRGGALDALPLALRTELRALTNPSADEFPFAIGIKSDAIGTPPTLSDWGDAVDGDVSDYHPANLAFFHVDGNGSLRPAAIDELRAYFDATLARRQPLVAYDQLARPADVQIVRTARELAWEPELRAKAERDAAKIKLDQGDRLIAAYDACGNVAVRRLAVKNARQGHPTFAQWRAWLGQLPMVAILQSKMFAHSKKRSNGSYGRHFAEEGQSTYLGWEYGGYNEFTGLQRLLHESVGHGTERLMPLMQAMVALTAYLDAVGGTNFMERNYQTGPWEQHTTNLEAYAQDSGAYFREHPHHAQLLMTVLQADRETPEALGNGGLYTRLRRAMGLTPV